jgi:hypothetical protein
VLRCRLLGDFSFKVVTFVDELAIGVVAIGFEAGDDLFLLPTIERDRLQNDRITVHSGDVVFQHLQPPHVVIGFRQQAHAILQIDATHTLQPPP